jgi:heptosyltransferase II
MAEIDCRYFNGYKPCGLNPRCDSTCPKKSLVGQRVLLVHLGAMGAVVRSTALLTAIKRKYAEAHITWVTSAPTYQILKNHPLIDRLLTTRPEDLLALKSLKFDVALCIDKSLEAAGVIKSTAVDKLFGFCVDERTGAILPATAAAEELWQIGLSNQIKFFENTKPETELVASALELPYMRDDYNLPLTTAEKSEALKRRSQWSAAQPLVGINTGCSGVIAYKKLTVEAHRRLIPKLQALGVRVALLGGPEDHLRNQQIAYGLDVTMTPANSGLRDGLVSIAACDVVVTGDSLGMHMAISQKKWVVAWFGPTCAHEIDLFDRGEKILTSAPCSPCWRRSCQREPMCYDLVDLDAMVAAVQKGLVGCKSSSFTQPSSATFFSPSLSLREFERSGEPTESL